jgi:hypothetical protein
LNLAEALARTNAGVDARALQLLNAVRQRSDPTALTAGSQQALIDAIMRERRIEFLGEGRRSPDLLRLGTSIPAKATISAVPPTATNYIWPISARELILNPLCTDNL